MRVKEAWRGDGCGVDTDVAFGDIGNNARGNADDNDTLFGGMLGMWRMSGFFTGMRTTYTWRGSKAVTLVLLLLFRMRAGCSSVPLVVLSPSAVSLGSPTESGVAP